MILELRNKFLSSKGTTAGRSVAMSWMDSIEWSDGIARVNLRASSIGRWPVPDPKSKRVIRRDAVEDLVEGDRMGEGGSN